MCLIGIVAAVDIQKFQNIKYLLTVHEIKKAKDLFD